MAKFIMGLLVGVVIGLLSSSYFSAGELNDLTIKARSVVSRHLPVNN
jgi:preprotein translocase subunit SecF